MPAANERLPVELREWLTRASVWQFASVAFGPPCEASVIEMRALVDTLPEPMRPDAAAIVDWPIDQWEPEYFSVLGPAGVPACESSYERAAMAARGPLLADIAGYYEAFGYRPDRLHEVPDHVAVELGFLSYLAMKIAFAEFEASPDEAAIAHEAYKGFLRKHVALWLDEFADAVANLGSHQYTAIVEWVRGALRES